MHRVAIRQEIIDRVIARRGRLHWFDREEHRATLETHIQQFGDVATADEALQLLSRGR